MNILLGNNKLGELFLKLKFRKLMILNFLYYFKKFFYIWKF